jgi:radical S-adenosyl methionine domain-containing protein 2
MLHLQVFQCLLLEGENVGAAALRHAENFYVTEEQFEEFLQRHKHIPFLVAESNVKVVSIERYYVTYTGLHMLIH